MEYEWINLLTADYFESADVRDIQEILIMKYTLHFLLGTSSFFDYGFLISTSLFWSLGSLNHMARMLIT